MIAEALDNLDIETAISLLNLVCSTRRLRDDVEVLSNDVAEAVGTMPVEEFHAVERQLETVGREVESLVELISGAAFGRDDESGEDEDLGDHDDDYQMPSGPDVPPIFSGDGGPH